MVESEKDYWRIREERSYLVPGAFDRAMSLLLHIYRPNIALKLFYQANEELKWKRLEKLDKYDLAVGVLKMLGM